MTLSEDTMQRIIEACGEHTVRDEHMHCSNCGRKTNSNPGHWSAKLGRFRCLEGSAVREYLPNSDE